MIRRQSFIECRAALLRHLSSRSGRGLAAVSVWQMANYAIPLLTFPYLARVLGVDGFGLIALAGAILGYAGMVTDWGFGYSGTGNVARQVGDPQAVHRVVWSVITAKACLASFCTIGLLALLPVLPEALRPVLVAGMISLPIAVIDMEWALRGAERLGRFARASILGRLASVPLVYLLVRNEGDVALALLVSSLGGGFSALLSVYELGRIGLLGRPAFSLRGAWAALKGGTHLFLSTAIISLYTNTLTVVLGFLSGPVQTGLYSGAGRIKTPVQSLLAPISLVFFPRMSAAEPDVAARLGRGLLLVQGGLGFILATMTTIAAPLLVRWLLGDAFDAVVPVLQVLAWTIFLISISNVAGVMIMIPFDMQRPFTGCVAAGAFVGLVSIWPLVHVAGALGAATAALLSECAVTLGMLIVLMRRFAWMRPWPSAVSRAVSS